MNCSLPVLSLREMRPILLNDTLERSTLLYDSLPHQSLCHGGTSSLDVQPFMFNQVQGSKSTWGKEQSDSRLPYAELMSPIYDAWFSSTFENVLFPMKWCGGWMVGFLMVGFFCLLRLYTISVFKQHTTIYFSFWDKRQSFRVKRSNFKVTLSWESLPLMITDKQYKSTSEGNGHYLLPIQGEHINAVESALIKVSRQSNYYSVVVFWSLMLPTSTACMKWPLMSN